MANSIPHELKRVLTPLMVWGLGVGYVISGNYFGWNLGLEKGGTLGLAIATAVVIVLYVTFTYSYAELSCAIPKAGGAFDYTTRALGQELGFLAGMAQNIEFLFAPPAIAFGIGSYVSIFIPGIPGIYFSVAAYLAFTALNIYGIRAAAIFELIVTTVAVLGLIMFSAVMLPHTSISSLSLNALPHGAQGILAAVPFAICFFLGIEGVANLAEETRNPRRTMSLGFLATLFTLIALCGLTFFSAVGISGWEAVVFTKDGSLSDAPLPMAMRLATNQEGPLYQGLILVGLFGLVASFNGLMLAAGRSVYEFGRLNIGLPFLGRVHPKYDTPANALVANMGIGLLALFSGRTGEVITVAVLGALTVYALSMVSLLILRKKEPNLERPFHVPFYPFFPVIALVLSLLCLVSVAIFNLSLCFFFVVLMAVSFGIFKLQNRTAGSTPS